MSTLFASFSPTSKQEWVELLQKELKGESLDVLQKFNRIEEIILPAYLHREDSPAPLSDPGIYPFTRGNNAESNDWHIGTSFRITNEKTTNAEVLQALMSGTTGLVLHAISDQSIDFAVLLSEVGLEYVHTTFHAHTAEQATAFLQFLGTAPGAVVIKNTPGWLPAAAGCVSKAVRPFAVQAAQVQRCGGTTWQEIAVALAEGHDLLVAQLEAGLTVDEACSNIHFVFGIGSKYFYEIAKFRAFRMAWARIVNEYEPANSSAAQAFITAETGFMHVALKDPYTNLLRQTTEAMSAVVAGVQQLVVQPYDWYSTHADLTFSRRMATNISLLLKEESYLDRVADPAGGSYLLDELTLTIAERAWELFKEIEALGGLQSTEMIGKLTDAIRQKAEQRLTLVRDKKAVLIGINAFPNPETVAADWQSQPGGWNGLPALIIESELQPA